MYTTPGDIENLGEVATATLPSLSLHWAWAIPSILFLTGSALVDYLMIDTTPVQELVATDSESVQEHSDDAIDAHTTSAACAKAIRTGIAVGAGVGVLTLPAFLTAIGLTPAGPVVGGWFAGNMGAGVAAGGIMATLQSMAMLGSVWKAIAIGGAFTTTGAAAGLMVGLESQFCTD